MTESRLPATIDQLVTLLRDPETGVAAGVSVYDGPLVTGAEPARRVFVGYDGNPDGGYAAADSDQDWSGVLGAKRRDETFSITCAAVATNGAGNVKAARDDVYAVFADVSRVIRANVTLGFPPPTTVQVRNPALHQYPTEAGIEARISFEIAVSTRI